HSDPYLLEVYEKGKDGKDPFYYSQAGSVLENSYWSDEERDRVFANPRYVKGWTDCPEGGNCDSGICRRQGRPILPPIGRQVILGAFVIAGGYFFDRYAVGRIFTDPQADEVEWHGENHFHTGRWELDSSGIWRRLDDAPSNRLYMGAFDLGGNKMRKR